MFTAILYLFRPGCARCLPPTPPLSSNLSLLQLSVHRSNPATKSKTQNAPLSPQNLNFVTCSSYFLRTRKIDSRLQSEHKHGRRAKSSLENGGNKHPNVLPLNQNSFILHTPPAIRCPKLADQTGYEIRRRKSIL